MAMQMNISQGMRQEQKLSSQVILVAQMLQMNALELETAIQQELETNPLLELDERDDDKSEKENEETADGDEYDDNDSLQESKYDGSDVGLLDKPEKSSDLDWDDYFQDGFKYSDSEDLSQRDPDDDWERPQVYDVDIQQYLTEQLKDRILSESIEKCVTYLIGCVGDKGFLDMPQNLSVKVLQNDSLIRSIDKVLLNEMPLGKAPKDVREAFEVLQSFTPKGIGARDLRECFLLQAKSIPDFSKVAIKILEEHYDLLLELRYQQIAKAIGTSTNKITEAVQELSKLNPHPVSQIPVSSYSYITPDFIVAKELDGSFSVKLRDGTVSKLCINASYKSLVNEKDTGKVDKQWIREKLNSANMFINSIESRRETMLLVMNAIVRKQFDFFARGPQYLHPMILQDVADEIKRDISTVNRVTNGKFVQTPHGVFELKQFFSIGVAQEDGTEISNSRIKEGIRSIIESENKVSPLTDQEIAEMLEKRGLKVARRTVNKYREEMGILPVRIRRKAAPKAAK